jgi:RHS repeat-associated protein
MLGTDDTAAEDADTSLLYAGEYYDSDLSQYYLRARYYNPWSGTFNRTDPFAGSRQDPQSLHKYTYAHNNPVNMIDPSGKIGLTALTALTVFSVLSLVLAIGYSVRTRRNTLPKHVTICISVSTGRDKPNTWNTPEIEQGLDTMFNPVWARLEVGQTVDIELIEEEYPPGQLGWTEISETERLYNGRIVFQKSVIPVLVVRAYAYTPIHTTYVSTEGTINYMQGYGYLENTSWPVWWTNVVAHEQLYLGTGRKDRVLAEKYDLGSRHQAVDRPAVLSDEAIENMLSNFRLSLR